MEQGGSRRRRAARLVARGAQAVGCTELPLAVPHAARGSFGALLTDSIDALAWTAIRRCGDDTRPRTCWRCEAD